MPHQRRHCDEMEPAEFQKQSPEIRREVPLERQLQHEQHEQHEPNEQYKQNNVAKASDTESYL